MARRRLPGISSFSTFLVFQIRREGAALIGFSAKFAMIIADFVIILDGFTSWTASVIFAFHLLRALPLVCLVSLAICFVKAAILAAILTMVPVSASTER